MSSGAKKRRAHINKKKKMRTDFILTFGRYKGTFMSDVPVGYLDWLLGAVEEKPHLRGLAIKLLKHLNTRTEWR